MGEISRLFPFLPDREYIDKNGRWTMIQVDPIFDKYVTETFYYYTGLDERVI